MALSGYTIHLSIFFILLSTIFYFLNLVKKKQSNLGRDFYYFSTLLILISFLLLSYHFLSRDFKLAYVNAYSSRDLSLLYTISALWAGQEGKGLLWALLSLILGLFLMKNLKENENLGMFLYNLQIISLLILLFFQSPFKLLPQTPMDGNGLNPLLINPWMAIHPPFMFLGYAAYGIPFVWALILALNGSSKDFYIRSYKWVIFSWVTMGIGIILGGFWAYETLGWGGFWGWDPVENASLIPWLLMTALIHGLVLQRKYKIFYKSNFILSVLSFFFILYGTFLTRSGILQDFSVHSFVDLGIKGLLIFIMLFFLLLGVFVFIFKFKTFPKGEKIEFFFTKSSLLFYSVLILIISSFFVFLGTSSPILTGIFGKPAKVGNDFYINTNLPVALIILLLLSFYTFFKELKKKTIFLAFIIAFHFAAISFLLSVKNPIHILLIFFAIFSIILQYHNYKFKKVFFIHSGVVIFLLGSLYSTGYDKNYKLKLNQGEPIKIENLTFKFLDFKFPPKGKSYAEIEITKGKKSFIAKPKLWQNQKMNQLVANPDIKVKPFYDLYLALEQYNPQPSEEIVEFEKGEKKEIEGFEIKFNGFQFKGEHQREMGFEVACLFEVKKGERVWNFSPIFSLSERGLNKFEEIIDEGGKIKGTIERIDATTKKVFLKIRKTEIKPYVILSVMKIPFIILDWLSSILIIVTGILLHFKKI